MMTTETAQEIAEGLSQEKAEALLALPSSEWIKNHMWDDDSTLTYWTLGYRYAAPMGQEVIEILKRMAPQLKTDLAKANALNEKLVATLEQTLKVAVDATEDNSAYEWHRSAIRCAREAIAEAKENKKS